MNTSSNPHPGIRPTVEALCLFALTALASGVVFLDWGHAISPPSLHPWLDRAAGGHGMFLFLVWSTTRFSSRTTIWLLVLVICFSVTGTVLDCGPFVGLPGMLLVFLISYLLVGLVLAHYAKTNTNLVAKLRSKESATAHKLMSYLYALDEHAIVSATNVRGDILAINDKFCEISGYSQQELMGQNHRMVKSGEHPPEFFRAMYRCLAEGKTWNGEICNRAKDGHLYWTQATMVPFMGADGKPAEYVSIRTDISAQKQSELELNQSSQVLQETYRKLATDHRNLMELKAQSDRMHRQLLQTEKMSSVGHLAAGVAHEINNPVGFVSSNLNTLGKYIDDLMRFVDLGAVTPPGRTLQAQLDLDFIRGDLPGLLAESRTGLERIRKIVAALKDFSHVGETEWQSADLLAGLESTLNVAWHELKYKTEIIRELTPLPRVFCDPAQINQVFLNLLVNAAQSIATNGTITLRSGVDAAGTMVWIEIADTGCGMNEDTRQHLFDPFFTTKPVGAGTGLGLSISWDIMQLHNGTIDVTSAPGDGSCFRLTLPVAGPVPKEIPA